MNEFIKQNWFKIIVAVALIIISLSIFYYLLFFLPKRERENKIKNATNKTDLDFCFDDAMYNYNREMRIISSKREAIGSIIGDIYWIETQKEIESSKNKLQQEKENCLKQYPQK